MSVEDSRQVWTGRSQAAGVVIRHLGVSVNTDETEWGLQDFIDAMNAAEPWRARAACKGKPLSIFFPERGDSRRPGRAVCEGCPVAAECHEHAERVGEAAGIWGGRIRLRHKPIESADAA